MELGETVISSIERAGKGIIGCKAFPLRGDERSGRARTGQGPLRSYPVHVASGEVQVDL
jgi:hypothetical protein